MHKKILDEDGLLKKYDEYNFLAYKRFQPATKQRLITILKQLEQRKRVSPQDLVWLQGEHLFVQKIAQSYHMIEAVFYEHEYQLTRNLWNIANASSHWRGANKPKKAIKLTDNINMIDIHDHKLRSALLTTRGAAFRDSELFESAEICALKAICFQPESYRPYNLVGALYYDRRKYEEGDMWFEEAIQRGATPNDVDAELKRIVKRTKGDERQQLINHLLQKDPIRYAWAQHVKIRENQQHPPQKIKQQKKALPIKHEKKAELPIIFTILLDVMKKLQNGQGDWITFTDINKALRKKGCRFEEKFKPFMLEAQQRGLVKIQQNGQQWDAKLS